MEFNFLKEQYKELLNICRTNKKEVSGKMYFSQKGSKYFFDNYKMDDENIIAESNKERISFKLKELLEDFVFGTYRTTDENYVMFHTHPGFLGAVGLSDEDREFLKDMQEMASRVTKSDGNKSSIKVVSGVISRDKIGFYYYDTNLREFKRVRTYVNGIEIIPDLEADGSKIKTPISWKSNKIIKNNNER